jgi:hypothetical protein
MGYDYMGNLLNQDNHTNFGRGPRGVKLGLLSNLVLSRIEVSLQYSPFLNWHTGMRTGRDGKIGWEPGSKFIQIQLLRPQLK